MNKIELLALSALFLAPCAMIVVPAVQAPSLFALHPAANALAFLVCFPASVYAMLARKASADFQTRVTLVKVHMFLQLLALVLMGGAGAVAYLAKEANQKPHFVSTHSWIAGATSTLFTLNMLGGLGTTFGGKKTSWQWKNPGHRIGGMLTFVLGGAASVYGVYSGGWGQAMLGADKQLQVSGLIVVAYALLFVKALTSRAATQKKQA
uniref:Cytochrome b561 domain-containing protein n=1 Tax=Globisporangium ultimum (strain ATCC 200006 / CBS 805.95 / DAOM BR144) TaxID=431595 RepID=K3WWE5_GLOUD